MGSEILPQTKFYDSIRDHFANAGWTVYSSHRGVVVRSKAPTKYHSIVLIDYPLGPEGPPALLPRLKVNTYWGRSPLPKKIAKHWGVADDPNGIFHCLGLEITFTIPEEGEITGSLPKLIDLIEGGAKTGFEAAFPMGFRQTPSVNIWTKSADEYSRAYRQQKEARRSKRLAQNLKSS